MLILINEDKNGFFRFAGHPGNDIGDAAAYFLFLPPVEFAGHPDVDVGHDLLLGSGFVGRQLKLYTRFKETWLCFAKDAIVNQPGVSCIIFISDNTFNQYSLF